MTEAALTKATPAKAECPHFSCAGDRTKGACSLYNIQVDGETKQGWCHFCRKTWRRREPPSEPDRTAFETVAARIKSIIRDRFYPSTPLDAIRISIPQAANPALPVMTSGAASETLPNSPCGCSEPAGETIAARLPEDCVNFGRFGERQEGCPQKRPIVCGIYGPRTWSDCQSCSKYVRQND